MKQQVKLERFNGIKARVTVHRRDGLVMMKYYNFDEISDEYFKIEHYKFKFEAKRGFFIGSSVFSCDINIRNNFYRHVQNFTYNIDLSKAFNKKNYSEKQLYNKIRKKVEKPNNCYISQENAELAKHFLLREDNVKNLLNCIKDSKHCIMLVIGE